MPFIEWNDALCVGVEEVDNQHKTLIDIINLLYDAICENKDYLAVELILDELLKYTKHHFSAEENHFNKLQFHNTEEHIKERQSFIKKIVELQTDFKNNKDIDIEKLFEFLKNWLINHIMQEDQKYGRYFIE